jgi:NADH-quinone oxidoreductase subunit G
MLDPGMDVTLLFGIEPDRDIAGQDVVSRMATTGFLAAFTAYDCESLRQVADLMLPIGTFAETSGTFINCEGRWQSFAGIANAVGEARPGWKVLRVLGNLLDAAGFDYESSEELRDELHAMLGEVKPDNRYSGTRALPAAGRKTVARTTIDVPMYAVDPVVRRATALQLTPEARRAATRGRQR